MPQLPEVQTVRRFLEKALLYPKPKTIKNIQLYYEPIVKEPTPQHFKKFLIGQSFTKIDRYGKFLLLKLQHHTIISHLRMEGKYAFYDKQMKEISIQSQTLSAKSLDFSSQILQETKTRAKKSKKQKIEEPEGDLSSISCYSIGKHDHVEFQMTDGSSLVFSDVRKFGTMHLVEKGKQMEHKSLYKLGPEVNQSEFTLEYFAQICQERSKTIKEILLTQEIVCGIGNIYADEILFAAGVHPETSPKKLSEEKLKMIIKEGKRIIDRAIENKGTTFRSFSANNEEGQNQNYLCVYGKAGQNCPKCQTKIKKIVVGQRGTHFCPKCQQLKA